MESNSNERKAIVYLAGPMTGKPLYNHEAFYRKANDLTDRGYNVINPAILPTFLDDSKYLAIDMALIEACDMVCTIEGWTESAGAIAEVAYALRQGKKIVSLEGCNLTDYSGTDSRLIRTMIKHRAEAQNNVVVAGEDDTDCFESTTTTASTADFDGLTWTELLVLYAKYKGTDASWESSDWNNFGEAISILVEDHFNLIDM